MLYSYKPAAILLILIAIAIGVYLRFSFIGLIIYIIILIFLELMLQFLINGLRERFQWLITAKKDTIPDIDENGLEKFMNHGWDSELGWVRKPNTEHGENGKFGKTSWHINDYGARSNSDHEDLKSLISCYGDSFTFSRQVDDNETWEWFLSKLANTNVINWGIGNHGLDQSVLRLKREYPNHRTKIVIMGVVPDTTSRVFSVWKHFYEYGNVFGFKPRFELKGDRLVLIDNIINTKEKFSRLNEYLNEIRKHDYFYENKFKKEIIRSPYLLSIFNNIKRNFSLITYVSLSVVGDRFGITNKYFDRFTGKEINKYDDKAIKTIMKINQKWRLKLYKDSESVKLLVALVKEFKGYAEKEGFTPVFVLLSQKDDVIFIKKNYHFYEHFVKETNSIMLTIDLAEEFVKENDLDNLYSDDTEYGGHYSRFGNEFVANTIFNTLKEKGLI